MPCSKAITKPIPQPFWESPVVATLSSEPLDRLRAIFLDGKIGESLWRNHIRLFHRGEPLTETVWEKLMLGLTTRKYGDAVRQFTEAYGLEKSAVANTSARPAGRS